ncbi:MAG: hypothetical protein JNJ83_10955 [Verrucomicrobiaceae bacterium]|nr:hypothetical protein [Verrucomicrobiaceae bacterium]
MSRSALLESTFLVGKTEFLGFPVRPISILSLELCRRMGLQLLGGVERWRGLEVKQRTEQLALFLWAHNAPWAEVIESVRDGTWLESFDCSFEPAPSMVDLFEGELVQFNRLVDAASFEVRLRKGFEADKSVPQDLAPTCWISELVDEIAARYHWSEEFILCELPFVRAVIYHHHCVADRREIWTVTPAAPVAQQMAGMGAVAEALRAADDVETM